MFDIEVLESWEARLAAAEVSLRERERKALQGEPTADELLAFVAEHEKLSSDKDALADAYDEEARLRDTSALSRDERGSQRDRVSRDHAGDTARAGLDRIVSGVERDLAAGDRADSGDDRKRAARARRQASTDRQRARDDADAARNKGDDYEREIEGLTDALETRLMIGQAKGLLMARYKVTSDGAFRLLVKLSQQTHMKLREIAERLVTEHDAAASETTDADS